MPQTSPDNLAGRATRPAPRGMTAAELVVGLAMTSMVLAALAAAFYAMGHSWRNNGAAQSAALTGAQASARLEDLLRESKYIVQCRQAVSAADVPQVFLWRSDSWGSAADGAPQIGELALLEFDSADHRLYLYLPKTAAQMTASQQTRAAMVASWSDLSNAATPGVFKQYDFVVKTVIGEAVTGIRFNAASGSASARQLIEYMMTVTRPGSSVRLYGSAALRTPTTRPS